ncbi:tripartite tricarboxylate transporter permease [Aquibaculum sediminis]|uniref:tripartite tricarboxylate transporter permease n=1 Tax=Aquibaculum sediminis TaxID=3231907 RepID=UPI003451569A
MSLLMEGFSIVLEIRLLLLLSGAVALGIVAGAMPGISATMGVALLSPLTFTMEPLSGILSLIGVYCGAVYGGSLSAILLGIPGTPGAVATTLDGYAMSRQGKPGIALGIATLSSFLGGVLSATALMLLSYPIAEFALAFGPREYLALVVFALTAMAALSGGSFLKGLFAGFIGLFLASIGIDETYGVSRYHFGYVLLMGGISFIPITIGLFAVPETLLSIERIGRAPRRVLRVNRIIPGRSVLASILPAQLRSGVIGTIVGAVPGAGSDIAAIVGYSQGKHMSRNPKRFGTGSAEGIACAESANNAGTGGSLIPLLTLGIPGGAVTAIMLGTFMTHGLQPGPLLLHSNAPLVYQIFAGVFIANLLLLAFGLSGAKLFARVLQVPESILTPTILLLCVVGAYAMRNNPVDVLIMFAAGMVGYIMVKTGIPRAPLIIGLILGPMVEGELARSLIIVGNDWWALLTPISSVIWLLAIAPFVAPLAIKGLRRLKSVKTS